MDLFRRLRAPSRRVRGKIQFHEQGRAAQTSHPLRQARARRAVGEEGKKSDSKTAREEIHGPVTESPAFNKGEVRDGCSGFS